MPAGWSYRAAGIPIYYMDLIKTNDVSCAVDVDREFFKVFKEIYMLYGAYPSPYVYMLQHYMNNQFLSLNMQKLSAAAWCMFLILGIFLGIIYRVQRKSLDYL